MTLLEHSIWTMTILLIFGTSTYSTFFIGASNKAMSDTEITLDGLIV